MSHMSEGNTWKKRLIRIDFLAGAVVGLIALAIWAQAYGLEMGEIRNFGPGFLPKVLGSVIAVGAVVLIVWGWVQPEAHAQHLHVAVRGPVAVACGILFFACFIRGWQLGPLSTPQLGLFIVAPMTVVLTGLGSKEADPRELFVLGLGLTALATMLFADLLGMQLPLFPTGVETAVLNAFGYEWPKRFVYAAYAAACLGLFRVFGFSIPGRGNTDSDSSSVDKDNNE